MGNWKELKKKGNLSRNREVAEGFDKFSNNWAPICEMFGRKVYKHPWIINNTNKDLPVTALTPHHIVSVSSLDYLNKRYRKILTESLYNVSHPKNLLLLPHVRHLACELRVPRHASSHESWGLVKNVIPEENLGRITAQNNDIAKGYHFLVNGKVRKEIKKIVKKCKNYTDREIVDSIDNLSRAIAFDITYGKFKITLNDDDYRLEGGNGKGCNPNGCKSARKHNFYVDPISVREKGMTTGRLKTAYEIYK